MAKIKDITAAHAEALTLRPECANNWHRSAPARARQTCPECQPGRGAALRFVRGTLAGADAAPADYDMEMIVSEIHAALVITSAPDSWDFSSIQPAAFWRVAGNHRVS